MADEQAAPSGKLTALPKKAWAAIAGGALIFLLLGAGSSYIVLKHLAPPPDVQKPQALATTPAIYITLTPSFIANFSKAGRQRYLQAEISFLFREPALEQQLALHLPAIRNAVVTLINQQDFAALHTVVGKDKLREELRTAVNNILRVEQALAAKTDPALAISAEVEQVLFTNFVMQ